MAIAGEDGLIRLYSTAQQTWLHTLRSDRLYEGMNLSQVSGLSRATLSNLEQLGAVSTT